jgi:hypothetical protein
LNCADRPVLDVVTAVRSSVLLLAVSVRRLAARESVAFASAIVWGRITARFFFAAVCGPVRWAGQCLAGCHFPQGGPRCGEVAGLTDGRRLLTASGYPGCAC